MSSTNSLQSLDDAQEEIVRNVYRKATIVLEHVIQASDVSRARHSGVRCFAHDAALAYLPQMERSPL